MKTTRIILILIIMAVTIQGLCASEWDNYFELANRAYATGDYENALQLYQKILESGRESGELYFNLGNTYYKLNQVGNAILYYEKAAQFLPGDEALQRNLKIAELRKVDKIEPIPQLFLEVWWDKALNFMSFTAYGYMIIIVLLLTAVFLSVYILRGNRLFQRLMMISAIFFVIFSILFAGKIYKFETEKYGIILSRKTSVMSEPALGSSEVFILHEGTKVRLNREIEKWVEITLADGKTGWCKSKDVGII